MFSFIFRLMNTITRGKYVIQYNGLCISANDDDDDDDKGTSNTSRLSDKR
jgi:hypothetical protein